MIPHVFQERYLRCGPEKKVAKTGRAFSDLFLSFPVVFVPNLSWQVLVSRSCV
jgi:hypothetical protein